MICAMQVIIITETKNNTTMNIDRILSRFKRNGYNVTRCASGKITVKQPNGFSELFDSYNAAYEHYFC